MLHFSFPRSGEPVAPGPGGEGGLQGQAGGQQLQAEEEVVGQAEGEEPIYPVVIWVPPPNPQ